MIHGLVISMLGKTLVSSRINDVIFTFFVLVLSLILAWIINKLVNKNYKESKSITKSRVKEISMEKIVVQGGDNRLVGSVTIEGAKNAVLPLLAATILASEGKTVLQNVPILSDVFTMNQVVRGLNAKVDFDEEAHLVEVDATGDITEEAPYKYVSKMRASIVVLGPILARVGHAKVSMPGGCTIGSRPIDLL